MASNPAFAATPNVGTGVLDATHGVDGTNRDGSGTTTAAPVTFFTAGASGSKVEEIVVKATVDPADSVILLFLHDGSNFRSFDEWDIGNPAAGSTTVAAYRESRTYANLFLPNGWTLRGVVTVAPTTGAIHLLAFGGDL